MINIFAKVQETDRHFKEVDASMRELHSLEVLVGIPDDNAARSTEKGPVSNAELLFIHTNGSPVRHIPPRPVLEPAIGHHKDEISELLKAAADTALDGNISSVEPVLKKAGMAAQNFARGWFTDSANGWRENRPGTIQAKGSDRPLIDTGEMRKSITYRVKRK